MCAQSANYRMFKLVFHLLELHCLWNTNFLLKAVVFADCLG